jgi:hypothetical protein
MVVTKKDKYKDANSNNNSDKEDQDHIAISMEKVEEIARVANSCTDPGHQKFGPNFLFYFSAYHKCGKRSIY